MRLMVVDDDKNIREILKFGMGKVTVCDKVTSCPSAEEALQAFHSGEFDCMVVDYKLPGMNGIDFIKRVRRMDARVGVVLVTAVLDQKTAEEACNGLDVYSVVRKPFVLKDLTEKVAEAAELSRMSPAKVAAITADLDEQSVSYKDLGKQVRQAVAERREDTGLLKRKMVL